MDKHYYLVAALPELNIASPSPLTRGQFAEECGKWLTPSELDQLMTVERNDYRKKGKLPAEQGWNLFDLSLREGIARARRRISRAGAGQISGLLKKALEQKDPLSREKEIEMIRWRYLDGEEYKYPFDLNRLVLYFLKLQTLERLASFDPKKGERGV